MKAASRIAGERVRRPATKRSRPVRGKQPAPAIMRVPAPAPRPWELDAEAVTILKNSMCKGASDNEMRFCLTVARRYKLDPFKRQIWFVRRWDSTADNGHGGRGAMVYTPQVGIDGLIFIAGRDHKDYGSISLPTFGPLIEVSKGIKAPEWARIKAWKKGKGEPTEAEAWWSEYAPDIEKKSDSGYYVAQFWRKMPRRMLAKCATALAIRQAYPDLGGLYIPEECERVQDDYTTEGRQIVRPSFLEYRPGEPMPTSIDPRDWCNTHQCDIARCPSDEHTQEENERATQRIEERKKQAPARKVPGVVTISPGTEGQITVNAAIPDGPERRQLHEYLVGPQVKAEWLEGPKLYVLGYDLNPDRIATTMGGIRAKCQELGIEGVLKGSSLWR